MSNADSRPSARDRVGSEKSRAPALPFALGFERGRGQLTLADIDLPIARIAHLELDIPGLTFPFDLTGGTKRLRDRWLQATRLDLQIPTERLRSWLASNVLPQTQGLSSLEVAFDRGSLEVVGTVGEGPRSPTFVLRYFVDMVNEQDLALLPSLFVLLGPPAVTMAQVAAALAGLASPWTTRDGLTIVFGEAPRQALKALLPPKGYRLPDHRRLRLRRVEVTPSLLGLSFTALGAPSSGSQATAMAVAEVQGILRPGDDAVAEGQLAEARAAYLEALSREPGHPVVLERLAWADAISEGGKEAAHASCTRHLASVEQPGLRAALASLELEHGAVPKAIEHFERVLDELGPLGRSRLLCFLGGLEQASTPESAALRYEAALELCPSLIEALESLMAAHAAAGRRDQLAAAGARLVAALTSPGDRAKALVEQGELWLERFDDLGRAEQLFEQALIHDPDEPRALVGIASARAAAGDDQGALRCLDAAARAASNGVAPELEVRAHVWAGELWRKMGDLASAAARFRKAVDLSPEALEAVMGGAEVDADLGRHALAETGFRKAAELAEAGGDEARWRTILIHLARLQLEHIGGAESAKAAVARLAEAFPEDEEVRSLQAQSNARNARAEESSSEAEPDLEQIVPLPEPPPPQAGVQRATTPAGAEVHGLEDVDALLRAFEMSPSDRTLARRLAATLEARHDWPRLVAVLANLVDGAEATAERGELLLRLGDATLEGFDDAESAAECFVEAATLLSPDEGAAVAGRAADLFAGEGREEESRAARELAARLGPDEPAET